MAEARTTESCCGHMSLGWRPSRVADRHADMLICTACGHIHKMESWPAPVRSLKDDRCMNCCGEMSTTGMQVQMVRPGEKQRDAEPRCKDCGLTPEEARSLHDRLAALHPRGDYLQAALSAAEVGRHVLSLKLATAAVRFGPIDDEQMARATRLEALQALEAVDGALDEAWSWMHAGAPTYIWQFIADLEAQTGNVEGALQALERGLQVDQLNLEMWTEYAELLAHVDNRPHAIESAIFGIEDEKLRERCLGLLADIGERYYTDAEYKDALAACTAAGDWQTRHVGLAWLRARVAASQDQVDTTLEWLSITLHLDPDHAGAKEAYEKVKPKKRGGLFGLFGR